jgi:type I restriction enzyme S subunit
MADFISLQDVYSLTMGLPSIDEQKAIAEVLGALDGKIAANSRVVATADSLAEALTRRAFSGEFVSLADVASVAMGSSPPGASYNEAGNGVPFFQGVRDFGVRFPSRRVWTDLPVRLASAGDTLLSVRAPVGRTNLADDEVCIGRGLASLRAKDGRAMSLFHQVRAAHAAWAPYEAEGTVFGAINRAQLEGIDLPALVERAAAELETRLAELEGLVATALRETTALSAARDELLPLLMSGKVRVKDAEMIVEGTL